jgi:alkylation response protein AidB-like acyl-CoA dehydrogenase
MPLIAQAFVFYNVGSELVSLYDHSSKALLKEKSNLANYLHSISACAKARVSWFCIETCGQCRHMLGGHGYSSYSRLGRIYLDQDVNLTWEGDNNMLLQQTTKYVLRELQKRRETPEPASLLNFVNEVSFLLSRALPCRKVGLKTTS